MDTKGDGTKKLGSDNSQGGCREINNCLASPPVCDQNAICEKIGPAKHTCTCNIGYSGMGTPDHCSLMDACVTKPCHANSNCKSTGPGTYHCTCKPGYTYSGEGCIVDEKAPAKVKEAIEEITAKMEGVGNDADGDDDFPDPRGKRLSQLEKKLKELTGDSAVDDKKLLVEGANWGMEDAADPTEKKLDDVKTKVKSLEDTTQTLLASAAAETEQLKNLAKLNQAKNDQEKADVVEKTHQLLDIARDEAAHILDPEHVAAVDSQSKLNALFPQPENAVKRDTSETTAQKEAQGEVQETVATTEKTIQDGKT